VLGTKDRALCPFLALEFDRMKVTVLTADERIVSLDVEPDELVCFVLLFLGCLRTLG